jgi:hypothetical protein
MQKLLILLSLTLLSFGFSYAQRTGEIQGTIKDRKTQEPLIGVTIQVENTQKGSQSDVDGKFKITGIPTGSYNLKATYVGYKEILKFNIVVSSGNTNILNFEMEEDSKLLNEVKVVVNRSVSVASAETPNSIQKLSTEEIKNNPGGNFDISQVIQVLPGVGGTSGGGAFRNDIIIRGGAPNENVYYLDGIEVPVINHFSTQGSAGGPTGILNVSFIEDATLASSSFNAKYDNALSSVLQFKQRDGNSEHFQGNFRVSSSEAAATFEGPMSKKTTYLVSARRSYLQYLFQLIDLPIRPNYWDFQYKVTHKINAKTTLTAIGLGAIDKFYFGVPKETTPSKEYILRAFPYINQWNYTVGFTLKRLLENGFMNVSLSRNMYDNSLQKYEDGKQESKGLITLDTKSQEIENKLRIDVNKFVDKWEYSYGVSSQFVKYNADSYNRLRKELRDDKGNIIQPEVAFRFNTAVDFFKFGAFGQVSRKFFDEKLNFSAGIRTDMNSFTDEGMNPLKTLSPRVAASYSFANQWRANVSLGRYFKLPIYTVLGFRDNAGILVNKDNKYLQSDHFVSGLEFIPRPSTRFTLEGFYKIYNNYAVSARDGISLANQGGEYGAIGNEKIESIGKGKSYGVEFFAQQKLQKNLFAVFSYTLFWSQFSGKDGKFVSSAWDSRHLVALQVGRKFKKGWELGGKYRFYGGAPYTPFDLEASQKNYATLGVGLLDYSKLNTLRLKNFSQFDVRIDKKINFRKQSFDFYFDIQNALLAKNPSFPNYTFERTADNSGFATTDGKALNPNGSNAKPLVLADATANVTPGLGLIWEF